ncbi:hypothetical protein V6N11_072315 [Hibiscus sabdariffa]|uniref:Uncharacterized protein n=1 Tax=Hibiscus sabdariffa TaxID=183260 RepID=A0ABR2U2P9_9ROSI
MLLEVDNVRGTFSLAIVGAGVDLSFSFFHRIPLYFQLFNALGSEARSNLNIIGLYKIQLDHARSSRLICGC